MGKALESRSYENSIGFEVYNHYKCIFLATKTPKNDSLINANSILVYWLTLQDF